MFVDAVAEGRGVEASAVRAGYGQGRSMVANRALEANLVDRVDTIENVIGGLLQAGGSSGGPAAEMVIENNVIAGDLPSGTYVFDSQTGRLSRMANQALESEVEAPSVEEPEEDEEPVVAVSPFDPVLVD
jgi:ClpP class serine protease